MTSPRDVAARRWVEQGTELFVSALARIEDADLSQPSRLPGWTRAHVAAHVAGNAAALLNLGNWARTGRVQPMYASPTQRDADIESGSTAPPTELRARVSRTASALDSVLRELSGEQWFHEVRTAQGRRVPAEEIPWLRAREVMVHTVDLGTEIGFAALPEDFVVALVDDAVARRRSQQVPVSLSVDGERQTWSAAINHNAHEISGSLESIAAFITGRPGPPVRTRSGPPPPLPPWL